MGKTRIKDLPQASTYAADAVIAIDDSVNGTQKLQLSGILQSGWKLVSKSSGDTLETNAVNAVVMTGDTTVSLPASSAAGKANAFALTIVIQTKGTLTVKNNNGTTFNVYTYGSSFIDTGSTDIVDPFTAFDEMTGSQHALFMFEEIATSSGNYKVSLNKLAIHDGSAVTYTVTFVTNEGSSVETQNIIDGETAVRPPNPTRDNYDFINWCSDPELTTVYDFSTPVTENISLYAKWQTQERVTVTFDSRGGSSIASQTLIPGSVAIAPAAPTLTNYTFSAWYKDEALTQMFDFATPVTTDITLYAKYTITDPVTVTFMKDGSMYNTQTVPRNTTATAPDEPTKEKYNFTGWFTAASGGTAVDLTQVVTESKTLYAQYTIKDEYKATVTFMTDTTVYDQKVGVIGETLGEIPAATKVGYAFVGWYQKDESGAYTTEFTGQTVLTKNILVVYSKFDTVSDWVNLYDFLPDLEQGDILVAPSAYGFESIPLVVVDNNNYQRSSHVVVEGYTKTVTLQTKYVLYGDDDSETAYNNIHRKFDESTNVWKNSSIRTWLNNEDAPTEKCGNFLGSFKLDATGVVKTGADLTVANAFINALQKPILRTYTGTSTYDDEATCKVWLPSMNQVGWGDQTLSYGNENKEFDYSYNIQVKTHSNGTALWWWLRSMQKPLISGKYVWCMESIGEPTGQDLDEKNFMAPCMTLAYNTCTVTYKYNDGVTADTTQTRAVGAHAVKINPIRSGYYFDAWYTDEALTNKFDFTNTILTSVGVTLYAKWIGVDWTILPSKMSTMKVGDLVEAPSAYGFDKIVLEMVDRDHVDVEGVDHTTTHTVTLQTKCLLTNTDGTAYKRIFDNDSNDWESSDICTWLNGDFLNAFLKNADGTDKTGDDLVQSQAFIDAIQAATVRTKLFGSTTYKTTSDKVWLPSIYQVNCTSNYSNEGPILDKYSTFTMTADACTERVKTTAGTDGKGTGGSSHWWWLRTVHIYGSTVWSIYHNGGVGFGSVSDTTIAVTPCFTFKY